MRPYCRDLRDRVIAAVEASLLSQAEVAETFSVSLSTVDRQPDLTLEEFCARAAEARGVKASLSLMCRELQRLGLPRKESPSMTASGIRRGCDAFVTPSPSW